MPPNLKMGFLNQSTVSQHGQNLFLVQNAENELLHLRSWLLYINLTVFAGFPSDGNYKPEDSSKPQWQLAGFNEFHVKRSLMKRRPSGTRLCD